MKDGAIARAGEAPPAPEPSLLQAALSTTSSSIVMLRSNPYHRKPVLTGTNSGTNSGTNFGTNSAQVKR